MTLDHHAAPSRRPPDDRWVLALLLALIAASLVPVWITPILPLQDLPNHLLKVEILRKYFAGDPETQALYALNLRLLSNYTCYVVIFLLAPLVGLLPAAKIFVSLCVAGLPLSVFAWLRTVSPRQTAMALAAPSLAYGVFLAKGNINFCAGVALYPACLAAFASRSRYADLVFAVLATVLYFTHGLVFLALAAVVLGLVVLDVRQWKRACGLLPGLLCFAVIVLSEMGGDTHGSALVPAFELPVWRGEAFFWLFLPFGWGYDSYLAVAWVVAAGVCAAYTAALCAREVVAEGLSWAFVRRYQFLFAALGLGLLYVLAPVRVVDWSHLRVRFLPLAVVTALGALHLPPRRAVRALLAMVFVASALASLTRTGAEWRRGSEHVGEYLAGIEQLPPGAALLPLDRDLDEGTVRVNLHSWGYYNIAKGGWSPYLQAYPSYHPVVYREIPWAPEEDLRGQPLPASALQRAALCYDYVVVWAPSGEDVAQINEYFDPVYEAAHLRIWRQRGATGLHGVPPACALVAGQTPPPVAG